MKVKVSATCPWPIGGEKQLIVCGGFEGVNVVLAESLPKWAKSVSVRDGNIFFVVKPQGMAVIFR